MTCMASLHGLLLSTEGAPHGPVPSVTVRPSSYQARSDERSAHPLYRQKNPFWNACFRLWAVCADANVVCFCRSAPSAARRWVVGSGSRNLRTAFGHESERYPWFFVSRQAPADDRALECQRATIKGRCLIVVTLESSLHLTAHVLICDLAEQRRHRRFLWALCMVRFPIRLSVLFVSGSTCIWMGLLTMRVNTNSTYRFIEAGGRRSKQSRHQWSDRKDPQVPLRRGRHALGFHFHRS